jgi:OmpA-OmpF porin, OOP family
VSAPLPPPPVAATVAPIPQGTQAPRQLESFRSGRRETQEGGRTIFREQDRIIIRDPSGQSFVRHNEVDRFRYGARDVQVRQMGAETRTVVIRPDGTQIITVTDRDGQLLRRIRRDDRGREIVIIDNGFRRPPPRPGFVPGFGGFYVDLPPPVVRIPRERYIVEAETADPRLIYDTLVAPPVERIDRRYTLDEIRYSPAVRDRMPRIDVNTIVFETGSWEITPDQAQKLANIAQGLNEAISRNPREVFLIEGHTDAVGSDVDNLSLSDRRAEAVAQVLTEQFQVPAENLTSQGYGEQYLKVQTQGPEIINRRVSLRRITLLLSGQNQTVAPPPPGIPPPRR